jgi:DNA polymerase III subunit delta
MAKGKAAAGVYLIAGADPRLADEALEELLSAALGPERTHGLEALRGDETTWGKVMETVRTGSLFVQKRVVVVRNAEAMKGEGDGLAAYLDDPTPELTLIFVAAKPDKRKGVWRQLSERATVKAADPLKGRALRAHVAERIRRRGLRITDDGLFELLERVGSDLQRLTGELDKLEAFAQGQPRPLGADEIASVLGRGLARPLYKLGDALAARRPAEALSLVEELLNDGEPALLVLSTLHRALRTARGARALAQARVPREAVAARLRVPPFKVDDVLESGRRWSEEDLKVALGALDQADRRMKTGAEPRSALAAAVIEACRGVGRPAATSGRPAPSRR